MTIKLWLAVKLLLASIAAEPVSQNVKFNTVDMRRLWLWLALFVVHTFQRYQFQ